MTEPYIIQIGDIAFKIDTAYGDPANRALMRDELKNISNLSFLKDALQGVWSTPILESVF